MRWDQTFGLMVLEAEPLMPIDLDAQGRGREEW